MNTYPSSDYLIKKFTDRGGDMLLVNNMELGDGDALVITIACPHKEPGEYACSSVQIPLKELDSILFELAAERGGEVEEAEED